MARSTRARRSTDTAGSALITRETVFRLTPASAATSRMVGRGRSTGLVSWRPADKVVTFGIAGSYREHSRQCKHNLGAGLDTLPPWGYNPLTTLSDAPPETRTTGRSEEDHVNQSILGKRIKGSAAVVVAAVLFAACSSTGSSGSAPAGSAAGGSAPAGSAAGGGAIGVTLITKTST